MPMLTSLDLPERNAQQPGITPRRSRFLAGDRPTHVAGVAHVLRGDVDDRPLREVPLCLASRPLPWPPTVSPSARGGRTCMVLAHGIVYGFNGAGHADRQLERGPVGLARVLGGQDGDVLSNKTVRVADDSGK